MLSLLLLGVLMYVLLAGRGLRSSPSRVSGSAGFLPNKKTLQYREGTAGKEETGLRRSTLGTPMVAKHWLELVDQKHRQTRFAASRTPQKLRCADHVIR